MVNYDCTKRKSQILGVGESMGSDIYGIIYISFKESVNEVRDKIVKELEAAGYEIKI